MQSFRPLPDVRKIAVLRAINLGDYVVAVPALNALRAAYPDAEIAYLGKPWHKTFLEDRPGPVDRVIIAPVKQGVREEPGMTEDPAELAAFFAAMRAEQFDLAVQIHGSGGSSNPFILGLGARMTIGLRGEGAPALDRWIPYIYYQNEILRLLEVVTLVGAQPCDLQPRIAVTDADRTNAATLSLTAPYAVLHPGAANMRRRWPPERFAQVGDALAAQGLTVVITGTEGESEIVDRVIDLMHSPAVNACAAVSLGGLAAVLQGAMVMICNDTGPLHLAMAVGTPTIGLFWAGNLLNWMHHDRRFHRPLISWMLHCPRCGERIATLDPGINCPHDSCFIESITVEAVISSLHELLNYGKIS